MKNKTKYMNTDILKAMQTIVETHVKHYQSDFDIDTESLRKAALEKEKTDRTFIWMCRECGTWLLKERDLFIRESHEYSVFTYYAETRDSVHAFIVEVTGFDGGTVLGNLYAFNYEEYYQHIKTSAVPAQSIIITYEYGQKTIAPTAHFTACPDKELGQFMSFEFMPESEEVLEMLLRDEKQTREHFKEA